MVLHQKRDLTKLREDVREMRLKMREQLGSEAKSKRESTPLFNLKQDAGGIVDIEFMVQYAALAWVYQAPKIVQYTDNIRILGSLEEAGLLDATSVAQLIAAYKAYRSTGHRLCAATTRSGFWLASISLKSSGNRSVVSGTSSSKLIPTPSTSSTYFELWRQS